VGGRRIAQSTSLLWEQQVGDAVGIDKGNVAVVLDVVVKSCNVKKYILVTQIKRYSEKKNLVCRGSYSRTKGNVQCGLLEIWCCGRRSGDDRVEVVGERVCKAR
jgi:hypothetical protein